MCVLGRCLLKRADVEEARYAWKIFETVHNEPDATCCFIPMYKDNPENRYFADKQYEATDCYVGVKVSVLGLVNFFASGYGFWSFKTRAEARKYLQEFKAYTVRKIVGKRFVIRRVEVSGIQVEYKKGYRSQFMRIIQGVKTK